MASFFCHVFGGTKRFRLERIVRGAHKSVVPLKNTFCIRALEPATVLACHSVLLCKMRCMQQQLHFSGIRHQKLEQEQKQADQHQSF